MPHIDLREGLPGILGPMAFRPETAKPLNEFTDILLRGPGTLSPGERELIAAFVSTRNDCLFCQSAHGAAAAHHLGGDVELVDAVKLDYRSAAISEKLKALLAVAEQVREGGKHVTEEQIAQARTEGATDQEIHDTVLIAAAFSMFNRYVDGLATWAPAEPEAYRKTGAALAEHGYVQVGSSVAQ